MNELRPSLCRAALWCLPLLMITGCPIDERTLDFGFAVGSANHGEGGGDPSFGGEGGTSGAQDAGGGGEQAAPLGGAAGMNGGALNGGARNGGAPAAEGGEASGGASGNSAAGSASGGGSSGSGAQNGGAAGNGGNPNLGPCGDINLNGVEDCDETLVSNANFKQEVAEWSAEANVNQVWSANDARGKADSGSLVVTSVKPGQAEGWSIAGTGQCVSANGGETYEIGARAQIPGGQAEGRATINLAIFGNDACQGTFLTSTTPALLAATGDWHVLNGTAKMPPATRSFYLRLAAEKPNAQPSLEVHFDDVLVRKK
jgi:hypothetical protein